MAATKGIDATASTKRLAWAYGCAKAFSAEESRLLALLQARMREELEEGIHRLKRERDIWLANCRITEKARRAEMRERGRLAATLVAVRDWAMARWTAEMVLGGPPAQRVCIAATVGEYHGPGECPDVCPECKALREVAAILDGGKFG